MHPAKSVIAFTVLSGLGYGTISIVFLSLLSHPPSTIQTLLLVVGMVLATVGLLSSTFHLGRPERAWRALSQWRTSWLSREGVCAFLSFICPVLIIGLPLMTQTSADTLKVLAVLGIVINIATVHCTAMIYASLKPIPAWHNALTPMLYQLLSITSGSLLALAALSVANIYAVFLLYLTVVLLIMSMLMKYIYWHRVENSAPVATASSATGLKGTVKPFERPHSAANYLMKEMMFQVGRAYANQLRRVVFLSGFIAPTLLLCFCLYLPQLTIALVPIAFVLSMIGLFSERWLFFAEAKHVVSLYYGNDAV